MGYDLTKPSDPARAPGEAHGSVAGLEFHLRGRTQKLHERRGFGEARRYLGSELR